MITTRRAVTYDGIEYAPGRRYRVLRDGLRLSGWGPLRNGAQQGWGQTLHTGDVITCTGFGPGWGSDPGYGVEWTSEEARAAGASHCDTWPSVGGVWAYRPPAGWVEPIEEPLPPRKRDDNWSNHPGGGGPSLREFLESKGEM